MDALAPFAAMYVGAIASLSVILVIAACHNAWQALAEQREGETRRRIHHRETALMRRESALRRRRDIRLGRLASDPRDQPRDECESVRMIGRSRPGS